jgi:nicotinamidase-related amidase/type 1 glutamine amidotransferase
VYNAISTMISHRPVRIAMHHPLRPVRLFVLAALGCVPLALVASSARADDSKPIELHTRARVTENGRSVPVEKTLRWDPKKTAVVICDMWDNHWCQPSAKRVAEMAPRMNEVVSAARKQGMLIIHCPSDTMEFYKDTPQRKLAQAAPPVGTPIPLERWRKLDPEREGPLPIDDKDGGCDCDPPAKNYRAWSRQIETIKIEAEDAITDSLEAFYLMKQRGIENVVVMGVHTNMCVLGRPFSIRQMVLQGQNVVLVRDMTDTMYNPAQEPHVSHFTGNDLVAEHIEKYWCPTITSVDFLGGKPFRFEDDHRKRLVMVISEDEYKTEVTLPEYAAKNLGQDFKVDYVFSSADEKNNLPMIGLLNDADLALISVRRRVLPIPQMEVIRRFIEGGKPVVGIRTASHAFELRDAAPPPGYADWQGFDKTILGCDYTNHFGNERTSQVLIAPGAEQSPLLAGVKPFPSGGSLYKSLPLTDGAQILLIGQLDDDKTQEPVAWTFQRKDGGRTFYTSLGHVNDFKQESFTRLLTNGLKWAAGTLKEQPAQ